MIKFLFALCLSLLPTLGYAQAGNPNMLTAEALDVRNRIESEVQKNLQNLLATRLDPTTFTIAVRARISVVNPPKPPEQKAKEELPEGMDLGAIDVRSLLDAYEKQIEELKIRREEKKDTPVQYEIKSIEVAVGLSDAYPKEYQAKFTTWLKAKMRQDYGPVALANVNPVKFNDPNKKEEKPEEKAPEKPVEPKPPFEPRDFLPLAAALLLGLALIIAGKFLKSGLTQVATAQKPLTLEPKGEWMLGTNKDFTEDENPENLPEPAQIERISHDEIERLVSKIAFVCMELGERVNELVRVWVDSGDEGFIKTALLIDTLINAREKIMSQTGTMPALRIPIDEELVKLREENLAESYRQVSTMADEDKTDALEQIYWDLISLRTLGLQSLRRPFDFLQGMAKENVMELLSVQKEDAQALALVYLPTEVQSEILNEYDEKKKTDVIKNMLLQSQISQSQIWDIDTSVKVSTINASAVPEEKLVNLFPRTVEVLRSLAPVDEIKILRQIVSQLPENGLVVKQQYTTLAFIDEWKVDYVRKLAQNATGEELVTLIRQIPSIQNVILEQVSPKVKTIIEDDLKLATIQDSGAIGAKLSSLKAKWNRLVAAENIPMSRVLEAKRSDGGVNAAA